MQVFKRQRPDEESGDVDENHVKCIMSDIITAATTTQVYVLTASGRFESLYVRGWAVGSLYGREAELGNLSNAGRNVIIRPQIHLTSSLGTPKHHHIIIAPSTTFPSTQETTNCNIDFAVLTYGSLSARRTAQYWYPTIS
jgi:hypothetical protein